MWPMGFGTPIMHRMELRPGRMVGMRCWWLQRRGGRRLRWMKKRWSWRYIENQQHGHPSTDAHATHRGELAWGWGTSRFRILPVAHLIRSEAAMGQRLIRRGFLGH